MREALQSAAQGGIAGEPAVTVVGHGAAVAQRVQGRGFAPLGDEEVRTALAQARQNVEVPCADGADGAATPPGECTAAAASGAESRQSMGVSIPGAMRWYPGAVTSCPTMTMGPPSRREIQRLSRAAASCSKDMAWWTRR